jgi:hypothetical protein
VREACVPVLVTLAGFAQKEAPEVLTALIYASYWTRSYCIDISY